MGSPIDYVQADYLAWQPDRTFDLVTMIWCDFSALAPADCARLLASVRTWLSPNGAFLFDVHALPFLASRQEGVRRAEHPRGGFWSAAPYTEVVETFVYPAERVSLDRHEIAEADRTWTVWNWVQAYDPASLAGLLEAAGLTVDAVLGDVAGAPYDPTAQEFAVIARPSPTLTARPGDA